jgi:hypothetical protein
MDRFADRFANRLVGYPAHKPKIWDFRNDDNSPPQEFSPIGLKYAKAKQSANENQPLHFLRVASSPK